MKKRTQMTKRKRGRPKKPPTKPLRVPVAYIAKIKAFINSLLKKN